MQYEEFQAILRRGERDERRKRRQFSLRKLLLWTAAAALLLGLLRVLGLGPIALACIALWIVIVVGLRLAAGSPVAWGFSVVTGVIAGAVFALAGLDIMSGALNKGSAFVGSGLIAVIGGYLGLWTYPLLELLFRGLGLPDGLLRSKTYDRQRPP